MYYVQQINKHYACLIRKANTMPAFCPYGEVTGKGYL